MLNLAPANSAQRNNEIPLELEIRRNASRPGIGLILEARNPIWLLRQKRDTARYNFADLKRNLYPSTCCKLTYPRFLIDLPPLDYANELFPSRLHLSRFWFFRSIVRLKRRDLWFITEDRASLNVSKIRKGRNTIYGQYVRRRLICIFPGCTFCQIEWEGKEDSDIFHFVSNRGTAIRRVAVAASPDKQTIAIMLSPEHEAGAQDLRENLWCLGGASSGGGGSYSNRM